MATSSQNQNGDSSKKSNTRVGDMDETLSESQRVIPQDQNNEDLDLGEPEVYIDIAGVEHSRPVANEPEIKPSRISPYEEDELK